MTRVHLVDSDTPLKEGSDVTAKCGAIVSRAAWAFMWDNEPMSYPFRQLCGSDWCRKCLSAIQPSPERTEKRYLYGAIPGEEAMRQKGDGQ